MCPWLPGPQARGTNVRNILSQMKCLSDRSVTWPICKRIKNWSEKGRKEVKSIVITFAM